MNKIINISGKYRNVVTSLSRLILEKIKVSRHNRLSYEVIMFKEIINNDIPLHFYLGLQTMYSNNLHVTGDAYNPTDETSNKIPYIEITVATNNNKEHRSEIAMKLRNALRHEIEHLTQSGLNTLPGKYLPDDQLERALSNSKEYLLLEKEVPAMLKGLHFQAAKERRLFLDVIEEYFQSSFLDESEIIEVKKKWQQVAKKLNLPDIM